MDLQEIIRSNRRLCAFAAGLFVVLPSLAVDYQTSSNSPPASQTSVGAQTVAEHDSNNSRLRRVLERYPAADANGDGVLTMEEARAYREKAASSQTVVAKSKPGTNNVALLNPPTFADVKYGPYGRNTLDFWKAKSDQPAPVVVFIHGGGFQAGDKSQARKDPLLEQFLKAGISFAAINYRFREKASIQDILHDAARAIQFIRFKAAEWSVDKKRIAAYGGSAGAGTSLWLAARDDLADPKNADPVLRESTRLVAAGLFATQATYDLVRWEEFVGPFKDEWLQSPNELAEFYHLKSRADLKTPEGERIRAECDMLRWLSEDDPPIYAFSTGPGGPSKNRGHYLHHPDHVREIHKRCQEVGVECVVVLADSNSAGGARRNAFVKFMEQKLGVRAVN